MRLSMTGWDRDFSGVSTDTRTLQPGNLFVALYGPHFDGHNFLSEAARKGAQAALVEESRLRESVNDLPLIKVADTKAALGQLARDWCARFPIKKVAVTGSCGKTTVKEIIAAIFSEAGPTLSTQGNFNNDIGVPLTLLKLCDQHRYAVLELGASGPGEIGYTCGLVNPQVAVITNAAGAHLEGFGSLEGVARAKGEIFSRVSDGGYAIINLDDPFATFWKDQSVHLNQLTFSVYNTRPAGILLKQAIYRPGKGSVMEVQTPQGVLEVSTCLLGEHNWSNILAATGAAIALDIPDQAIIAGIAKVKAPPGRLQIKSGWRVGVTILDDTYNANPKSVSAALEVLSGMREFRVLVLGDMAELGALTEKAHYEIGAYAKEREIDYLVVMGKNARHTLAGFGEKGRLAETVGEAAKILKSIQEKQVAILIKGSRSSRMEQVVERLLERG